MDDCPFCAMASGKLPARRIYEDEHAVAVLDIRPASAGHAILFPKAHAARFSELPLPLASHLGVVARKLSHGMLRGLQAGGTVVILPQGEGAGQSVPHLLIHLIPRAENDGLAPITLPKQPFTPQDLADVKAMLVRGIRLVIEGAA
jgi:histidine triad (HIT) family protein